MIKVQLVILIRARNSFKIYEEQNGGHFVRHNFFPQTFHTKCHSSRYFSISMAFLKLQSNKKTTFILFLGSLVPRQYISFLGNCSYLSARSRINFRLSAGAFSIGRRFPRLAEEATRLSLRMITRKDRIAIPFRVWPSW